MRSHCAKEHAGTATIALSLLAALVACCADPAEPAWDSTKCSGHDFCPPTETTKPFRSLTEPSSVIPGSSVTFRLDHHFSLQYLTGTRTTNLVEGEIVTLWWAVYNKPDYCQHPNPGLGALCGWNDLESEAVSAALMYGGPFPDGGAIVDESGAATWPDVSIRPISPDAEPHSFRQIGPGNGLNNVHKAEIHVIVQTHGAALTGDALRSQLGTLEGGCLPGEPYATTEPSPCRLLQVAVFPPQSCCSVPWD